jgi:ribosome-associated translation inhibitor RaiA
MDCTGVSQWPNNAPAEQTLPPKRWTPQLQATEIVMQIQVNTDNHIQGSVELNQRVETAIESGLDRFSERITRAEVHLSDENSRAKSHGDPMRCRLEIRPASRDPMTVTGEGSTLDQAISAAVKKMVKLLDSTFGRLDDRRS